MGATSAGLKEFAGDLQTLQDRADEDAKKVVAVGCNNIKKDARRIIQAASNRGYLPHYPYAIGYDVTGDATGITGEVGPDSGMLQGGLGKLLENGSVNNAPIPHLSPALDTERPVFEHYAEELGVRLLEGEPGFDGPAPG